MHIIEDRYDFKVPVNKCDKLPDDYEPELVQRTLKNSNGMVRMQKMALFQISEGKREKRI